VELCEEDSEVSSWFKAVNANDAKNVEYLIQQRIDVNTTEVHSIILHHTSKDLIIPCRLNFIYSAMNYRVVHRNASTVTP